MLGKLGREAAELVLLFGGMAASAYLAVLTGLGGYGVILLPVAYWMLVDYHLGLVDTRFKD